jgi:ATP-dependent exoDNAse (exonuclease V) alpha subunit
MERDAQGRVVGQGKGGSSVVIPLDHASRFLVYESRNIALAAGDMVRITQNGFTADKQRLNNGDLKKVKGFTPEGDIKLANGWLISKDYGNVTHGYCVTSYNSQSKGVDCVFVAESSESFRAADREQFYVSASRFKEALTIYTDNKAALLEAVRKSSQRPSATDLVKGQIPEAPTQTVVDKKPVQQTPDDAAVKEGRKRAWVEEIQKKVTRHQRWQEIQNRGRQSRNRGISL